MLLCFQGGQATLQLQHQLQGLGHRCWHLLGIPGERAGHNGGRAGTRGAEQQPQCSGSGISSSCGQAHHRAVETCLVQPQAAWHRVNDRLERQLLPLPLQGEQGRYPQGSSARARAGKNTAMGPRPQGRSITGQEPKHQPHTAPFASILIRETHATCMGWNLSAGGQDPVLSSLESLNAKHV